ncbi:MAG: hypothetical protein IJ100_08845 [Lachnospiraceae bacterium]|nr:hypothetical protein [Lachnospiraceae bacterium]
MRADKRIDAQTGIGTTWLLSAIMTLFLFQTLLENYFSQASYIDEGLAALFCGVFVLDLVVSGGARIREIGICFLILWATAAGLYGNWKFGIQDVNSAIYLDIVSHFKYALLYLGVTSAARKRHWNMEEAARIPVLLAKGYLIVLFVFGVLNIFVDLGMYGEIRYGLRNYSFVFGTPGIVTNTVLYIIMLLLLDAALHEGRSNKGFLLMAIAVLIMVIKSRSLILAATALVLFESFVLEKKQDMRFRMLGIAIIGGFIGYPQYQNYFVNGVTANRGTAPRQLFWQGGLRLFQEYFPYGTGFGTFGSSTAATNYSQLYYILEFNTVAGMQPTNTKYLNDTFWPMIFTQLGLFGMIPYILLMIIIFYDIYRNAKRSGNLYIRFAAYLYIANVLFSSIQSSYPCNNSMVMMTFIATLLPYCVRWERDRIGMEAKPEVQHGY